MPTTPTPPPARTTARAGDAPPVPTLSPRTVLVPLDGSPRAERALGPAIWLADLLGADIHVVTAGVGRDEHWWFHRYADTLVRDHPGVVPHVTPEPDVAGAVHDLAAEVGPTVVCAATHGRGRSAALTGSAFLSLMRRCRVPMIAVGPHASVPTGDHLPLVVCLDGTPASEEVIPTAAAWARRLGLHVRLLTVASSGLHPLGPDVTTGRTAFGPTDPLAYTEAAATHPALHGLSVDTQVVWELVSPHEAIVDTLRRRPATLVAVASHTRTGLGRLVLGSEASGVVHHSPIPVLVHPTGASAPAAEGTR